MFLEWVFQWAWLWIINSIKNRHRASQPIGKSPRRNVLYSAIIIYFEFIFRYSRRREHEDNNMSQEHMTQNFSQGGFTQDSFFINIDEICAVYIFGGLWKLLKGNSQQMSQTGHSQAGMSQGFSQGMSQGMYPSQGVMGFSQDIPDISQHDSGQFKNIFFY